jgi:capsular polysaccharide biosynthesis protein
MLAAITGVTAYLLNRDQTPVYRASQVVLIQPSRADLGLAEATRSLTEPLAVYLDSSLIADKIIENLGLDMRASELLGRVNIASDQFRLTVQIDVRSTDQNEAVRIASAWGQELVNYRNEENQGVRREDRVNALLVDAPSLAQIAPRPTFNGIAGALLGIIVGALIVFVLEYLESAIVYRREDLERTIETPILATIPHHNEG